MLLGLSSLVGVRRVMKCSQCQFENEADAKFCGNCGAPLAPSKRRPRAAQPAAPPGQIYCPKCGTPNAEGSLFCENCGSKLEPQAKQRPQPSRRHDAATTKKKTSWAWWILPWFGLPGIIAWAVVREKDRTKATYLFWISIIMSLFWWYIFYR